MGKTGKWFKHFLTGKKDKDRERKVETLTDKNSGTETPPPTTPKEKRRWSFRRSSAAKQDSSVDRTEIDSKQHALAVAVATAAAADAAAAAAKAAAVVIQLTAANRPSAIEEAAAVKIQSVFRAYLARKALNALKGLVKLQALVRGHLVRKQATATLRCMQALVTVQARARAQRLRVAEETKFMDQKHQKSTQDLERGVEDNIKIVEMDVGGYNYKPARNSYSNQGERIRTDMSPRTCSNHFEEFSTQSSPQCYSKALAYPRSEYAESLYNDYPNYMANTESSRAKVRSHSAPKQRPVETFERQPSRRRPSIEGRNVPRAVRMQRSSSHVGSTAQNYQYPWSVKLDKSALSLKDSECGSTSTNANYCRSLVGFDVQGIRY